MSVWWRLRTRWSSKPPTLAEYKQLEPALSRPLTDDPIRRRQIARKPAPKETSR